MERKIPVSPPFPKGESEVAFRGCELGRVPREHDGHCLITAATVATPVFSTTVPAAVGVNSAVSAAEQCTSICSTMACNEVSAKGSFPMRIVNDAASPTGYYLYFQKINDATGYNIYEGAVGTFYSHGSPTFLCNAVIGGAITDLGTGELRCVIAPTLVGDQYYLVTAHNGVMETTSGYDSTPVERPVAQNTCPP